MVASWTPCDESLTVSLSGQRVARMRLRRSSRSSSEAWKLKGRMDSGLVTLGGVECERVSSAFLASVMLRSTSMSADWPNTHSFGAGGIKVLDDVCICLLR